MLPLHPLQLHPSIARTYSAALYIIFYFHRTALLQALTNCKLSWLISIALGFSSRSCLFSAASPEIRPCSSLVLLTPSPALGLEISELRLYIYPPQPHSPLTSSLISHFTKYLLIYLFFLSKSSCSQRAASRKMQQFVLRFGSIGLAPTPLYEDSLELTLPQPHHQIQMNGDIVLPLFRPIQNYVLGAGEWWNCAGS